MSTRLKTYALPLPFRWTLLVRVLKHLTLQERTVLIVLGRRFPGAIEGFESVPFMETLVIPPLSIIKLRAVNWLRRASLRITPWPVYFWIASTDCDLTHAEWPERYPNGWTARRCLNELLDSAEGPTTITRISRHDYDDALEQAFTRDIAAERANY